MPRSAPFLFATFLVLGVLVSGCASAAQPAVQQAAGVQVDKGGSQVTVKGADGQSMTVDSNLPDEVKNLKVPDGFKSQGGGTMSAGGDKMAAASWKGTGQVPSVIDFFKSSLPKDGWTEDGTYVSGDGGMLNYSKPDGYGLTITVSKEEGNDITIAVLSGKSSKTPTPKAQPTAAKAAADETPTPAKAAPEPTMTPRVPTTGDVSTLPAELKDQPVPAGFAPLKDKSVRMATGGKFQMASAEFFGKMSVKDATTYYSSTLPTKGWDVDVESAGESESTFVATSQTVPSLHLAVNISESEEEAGTRVYLQLMKS